MKAKKMSKKLSLNKSTIANLNLTEQRAVAGGAHFTSLVGDCQSMCDSDCTICPTNCPEETNCPPIACEAPDPDTNYC